MAVTHLRNSTVWPLAGNKYIGNEGKGPSHTGDDFDSFNVENQYYI